MKKIWIPCTGVHGFEEKTKHHVPGTWSWRKNKIPCTRVHEILIFLPIHVPRYMKFWFFSLFLCVAQAVGVARHKNKFFFGNFFQHVKKLINFLNFVNIKVAKSKSNHLGFYCKLDFFDRTIRKIRNWNRNWVLIDGTPCIIDICSCTKYLLAARTVFSQFRPQCLVCTWQLEQRPCLCAEACGHP